MGILLFIIVITLVIAIHEYGHYLACRLTGIPVTHFGVGVGKPLLRHTDKRGTEWSLRPFPIGGFITPAAREMAEAKPLVKFFVAFAGPLANIIPVGIVAILVGKFSLFLKFLYVGYVATAVSIFNVVTFGFFKSPVAPNAPTDVSGPIGMAKMSGDLTSQLGFGTTFVLLFVVISLGLGLINLLPVPLLDGGRMVFAGVEAGMGRERTARIERYTNVIGVIIILTILVVVTITDIGSLF
jgi:regulator of sigma E protease